MEFSNVVHKNVPPFVLSGISCGRWYPSALSRLHCFAGYVNWTIVARMVKSVYPICNKLVLLIALAFFLQKRIFPLPFKGKLSMSSFPLKVVMELSLLHYQWCVLFCKCVACGLHDFLDHLEGVCRNKKLTKAGLLCIFLRCVLFYITPWNHLGPEHEKRLKTCPLICSLGQMEA